MTHSPSNFPWKSLGASQLLLFILSLLAFLDMQQRMEVAKIECGCYEEDRNNYDTYVREVLGDDGKVVEEYIDQEQKGEEETREKRSLKESLFNFTSSGDSSSKKELWVHSLSKIQMDELLEKCLSVHQYCTADDNEARGPPGPPISFHKKERKKSLYYK